MHKEHTSKLEIPTSANQTCVSTEIANEATNLTDLPARYTPGYTVVYHFCLQLKPEILYTSIFCTDLSLFALASSKNGCLCFSVIQCNVTGSWSASYWMLMCLLPSVACNVWLSTFLNAMLLASAILVFHIHI